MFIELHSISFENLVEYSAFFAIGIAFRIVLKKIMRRYKVTDADEGINDLIELLEYDFLYYNKQNLKILLIKYQNKKKYKKKI